VGDAAPDLRGLLFGEPEVDAGPHRASTMSAHTCEKLVNVRATLLLVLTPSK
jgi:hypothetical protein